MSPFFFSGKRESSGAGSLCTTSRQGGTLHMRSATLEACIAQAKVLSKTLRGQLSCTERRPRQSMRRRSAASVLCAAKEEQDLAEALQWTQLAAAQGFEGALEYLDGIQQRNGPSPTWYGGHSPVTTQSTHDETFCLLFSSNRLSITKPTSTSLFRRLFSFHKHKQNIVRNQNSTVLVIYGYPLRWSVTFNRK